MAKRHTSRQMRTAVRDGRLQQLLKDGREALTNVAKTKPRLYGLIARMRYPSDSVLRVSEAGSLHERPGSIAPNARTVGDTEIVIEGFPRSGNTFCVYAFGLAQGRPLKVAHHLHAPAQIMTAVRLGIPAVLLIRNPEGAVLSRAAARLTRERPAPPRLGWILSSYVRFYRSLVPFRKEVVVATFDEVTGDLGAVIDRVNETYGTTFRRFQHSGDNVQNVFQLMDLETRRANPSPRRTDAKNRLRAAYFASSLSALRESAEQVYAVTTSSD